jgi:hypothetical protein
MIFLSDRLKRRSQICVFLADLSDPKSDPTDLCKMHICNINCFLWVFYVRSSHTGVYLNKYYYFWLRAADNQPTLTMVVEEDHSSSCSSQLPSQHVLCYRVRREFDQEQLGQGGVNFSTVLDTPLPNHQQLHMSPVRQGLDGTSSHPYFLCSTPERIVALGHRVASQGDGLGQAVAAGVASGGFVAGGVVGDGVVAGGAGADAVVAGGVTTVGVVTGGRGARTRRGGGRRSRQSTGQQASGPTAGGIARGGVKNYTPAEVDSLLQTIKRVCPIGNDQWELVAELHSMCYAVCGRTADSIKQKFASLSSTQPTTGNPTMPCPVLMANEICEAINKRAGITDADVSDFFDEGEEFDDDLEDAVEAQDNNMPRQITVVTNEVPVVMQPDQPLNNQQQLVPAAKAQRQLVAAASNRRNSATSSGPLSTLASVSVAQTEAWTRQNVITSAIETATSANQNAFAAFLQQKHKLG